MRRFFDLVTNESVKLWGQTGFRVLTVILAVILLLTPLCGYFMSNLFNIINSELEDYLEQAEEVREHGDELQAIELETIYEAKKYFADLGIEYGDTEYSIYYSEYEALMLASSVLRILDSGKYSASELSGSYYSSLDPLYYFLVDHGLYDDTNESGNYGYNVISTVEGAIDERGASAIMTAIETALYDLRFSVENFSIKYYYDQKLATANELKASIESEREQTAALLNEVSSGTDREYYEAYLTYCEKMSSIAEHYERVVELLAENNESRESSERLSLERIADSALSTALYSYPLTESEFAQSSYGYSYQGFGDYNAYAEKTTRVAAEALEQALYSLEHDIILPQASGTVSAKRQITSQLRFFAGLLAVVFVCFGGIAVASEYSHGTIRLLLLKPRSRTSILCSKLVCIALWWLAFSLAAFIILTVENGLLLGVNDLFVPDLKVTGEGIAELPSAVGFITVFLEESALAALYIGTAVLFAVLTKKVALSIVCPMLVSFGASVMHEIALALYGEGLTFAAYTPFFYLDFDFLHVNAVDYCLSNSEYAELSELMYSAVTTPDIILGGHASIALGIIMIAACAAILDLISVAAFRKQRI